MQWYEKLAWYAVFGFAMTKSFELMSVIKDKINEDNELIR